MNKEYKTVWIITEGIAGTENQCLGVAEQLSSLMNIKIETKRVRLNQPWKTLSPYIGFEMAASFAPAPTPPWPDILITSGRKAVAASRYIKKQSGGRTFTLHIQDPRVSADNFDLLAVPAHDPARGKNVIVSTAAPNRITAERLAEEKPRSHSLSSLENPKVAVMIGGTSKAYIMSQTITQNLADDLARLDAGLMVTASRRTGAANQTILLHSLSDTDSYVWNGTGENPYFAFLALGRFYFSYCR